MSAEKTGLSLAETYCEEHGYRLTEPRRAVLKTVSAAEKALSAYDILHIVDETTSLSPKPPTIYRAIDFWQTHGFIHRIESLNAYVYCQAGHLHRGAQYMICDQCGRVEEIHLCNMPESLEEKISQHHFNVKFWNAELHGKCASC